VAPDDDSGNEQTLRTYQDFPDRYLERTQTQPSALVEVLISVAQPGWTVLELGSGPGTDADALESAELRVDRTDATPAFVERLRDCGRSARVLNALADDLGGPYDAVFANAVLLHFTAEELRSVLISAQHAVRPGGLLAATLKEGDGHEWSMRKMDAPRYFTYWRTGPLRTLLEETGWTPIRITSTPATATREAWITVLASASSGG
jgi:SAM-dependent methyltransferase